MKELQEKLQEELDRARASCNTDNTFDNAYSYGIEFAINLVKKHNTNETSDISECENVLKIGQKYKYTECSNVYEIKTFVDDCVVYKEKCGKISTLPTILFNDMVDNGGFVLLTENECETLIKTTPKTTYTTDDVKKIITDFVRNSDFITFDDNYCINGWSELHKWLDDNIK